MRNSADPLVKTTVVGWAMTVVNTLIDNGVAREAIWQALGCSGDELVRARHGRVPTAGVHKLWQLGVDRVGEHFGLAVADNVNPKTFDLLGPSIWYSGTLRDAFARLAKYSQLVHRTGRTMLHCRGDRYELRFLLTAAESRDTPVVAVEAFIGSICRIVRQIHYASTSPLAVQLQRAAPADTARFDDFFGTQVAFGAANNALVLPVAVVDEPLAGSHPAFACEIDRMVEKHLLEVGIIDTRFLVIARILEAMRGGELSLQRIAAEMGMTTRNLQFLLGDSGTSYGELVRDLRKDMALAYLADSSLSVQEVGASLGFAEPSSFTRAFKSWFGVAPVEFRRESTRPPVPRSEHGRTQRFA